ncbi:MAG TPA: glycosyltransferase [Bryobacteraceae bacterium]|nr:glycosyltransferase [Bryobacteraceae bacterium]
MVNSSPAVTVLMPVFETPEEMLDQAIASILCQAFGDFEFLILNDGSPSERMRLRLDGWAKLDTRIRLFHEPHRGVPGTSNRGLALARGEFVARQDADDWSEPDRLERQVAFLREHPEVVLAGTDTLSHQADGAPLWRLHLPHRPAGLAAALWNGNPFVHGSVMFRRAQAVAIGGYREQLPCASDYDFLWRLSETGKPANLAEVLYHYRYTAGSISARRAADQARVFRAAQALARARRRGEPENISAALAEAGKQIALDTLRASLKQADHFMLAGDFLGAGRAYWRLLRSNPVSALAWGKTLRLAVFAAIPRAREVCFR